MGKREITAEIVDGLLKFLLAGGAITTSVVAPNALIALDKPLRFALKKFDARSRERELKRILNYMKRKGFINTAGYEHGITITPEGRKRITKVNFEKMTIPRSNKWDKNWRLVFFDIPESKRNERKAFIVKLRKLGFRPLQRSTWIYPFPCRREIEMVTLQYKIEQYVSYIETSFIDNQKVLVKAFSQIL